MNVTYAMIHDPSEAQAAIAELEAEQSQRPRLRLRVFDHGVQTDDIALHESGALHGIVRGVMMGSIGAGAFVSLLGLIGWMPGALLPAVLGAIGLGAVYGAFVGFVAGTSAPDNNLHHLEAHNDGTLITVASIGMDDIDTAREILRNHGATEATPQVI